MAALTRETPRTIRLYGKLGTQFGRIHRYVVNSPRDAISALAAMVPGFGKELMTSEGRGIRYAVFVGKRNITEEQLEYPSGGMAKIAFPTRGKPATTRHRRA